MLKFSDIHFSILTLLAECGFVSRATLDLMDYNYYYLTPSLRTLLGASHIRIHGKD